MQRTSGYVLRSLWNERDERYRLRRARLTPVEIALVREYRQREFDRCIEPGVVEARRDLSIWYTTDVLWLTRAS